jgi:hypothetical protein
MLTRGHGYQLHRDLAPIDGLTKGAANSPEAYDSYRDLHAFSRELSRGCFVANLAECRHRRK